jgi:PA14 domain-containing protein/Big-like domain-containing protein/malectin (di-glucose binding ER protein)/ASPM-SPD-2-Hydin domain-containing protein
VASLRFLLVGLLALALLGGGARAQPVATAAGAVVYRVNAGGPALTGTPSWSADTAAAPSTYVNAAATGNTVYSTTSAIDTTHASIPAGTPAALFQTERWDPPATPELQWSFPVTPGAYEVRLYFAEIYSGAQTNGARIFDVSIEGTLVLNDFDVYAAVGANKGVVKTFQVTSDATLTIDFGHVTENPAIKGIEILQASAAANQLGASPSSVDFGSTAVNTTQSRPVQLTNLGASGDPSISVTSASITGANAAQFSAPFTPVTLAPGASTTVNVSFTPTSAGAKSATLNVAHSGSNTPLAVPLSGTGGAAPVGFGKSTLAGATSSSVTSIQFGPDNRLYVAQQDGVIKAYTVTRNGANSYSATATETISLVKAIPNHNDDGALNTGVTTRQQTGLVAAGTAANPVLYVSSSDPRIGAGGSGQDLGLDTNSGVISRLTWTGTAWQKLDLVRGLPRSEENHSTNGLQLDAATNTLYISQGGNTNRGAPANNFALLPEYALSGAVLKIDLNAIGNTTYDLPTLDDDTRPGAVDAGDPFGGNDGKNQAKLVPGGPVQVYAPGFRNPYDLVRTTNGRMYTIDNGSNAGWGDVPINEGPAGNCTNQVHEPGTTDPDTMHLISSAGYYGGHPNPTRGNIANTFDNPPQSPVATANPVECDYRAPGAEQGSVTTFPSSTNGIAEYTASNFAGAMKGDLLAASFDNTIYRVKLDGTGKGVVLKEALFSTVGNTPLDVTAQGDGGPFPGTIWVGDHGNGSITVFEPNDFGGGGQTCSGADSTTLDEDGDGFKNHDEITNGTNPCSAADVPPDWDGDKVSNLNDPDDDNDTKPDTSDPFAIDASNGTTTTLPVRYTWNNDAPPAGGLLNLGFTGLMTNGSANYATLFDPTKMTAGGAAGVTTVDSVPDGDAYAANNNQQYGFQFGVKPPAGPFTAHTRVVSPFSGITPQNYQSMGLVIGTGDQDNYVKLVTSANGGGGGIEFLKEVAGVATGRPQAAVPMPGPDAVDLYLTVDPSAATVQPSYAVTTGGVAGTRVLLGAPEPIPSAWLAGTAGLAVGIISTSFGAAPEFSATWDLIEAVPEAVADTTPPTVTGMAPPAGATGVGAGTNVEATFSESMNPATLTTSTFTLAKSGTGTPVAAVVAYDAARTTATLDPSASLEAGASYTATVKGGTGGAKDTAGNALAADKVWSFTVAATGSAGGLTGSYYDTRTFTNLKLTRLDPTVNFSWGSGSPSPQIGADTFSVRWTGFVRADFGETYTFFTTADDGVRLWVNGQKLIDDWTQHPPVEKSGSIALQAGQWYPVTLEYFEAYGGAVVTLSYASARTPKQIVPADHLRP